MEDDNNLWNEFDDGLHEHDEPMCAFENLPACTKPLFAGVAASACHSSTLISNYNAVADELARVSVSGDFDRTCVFAIARAPCSALDFKAISDPREYAYKFAEVVKTFAIEKCGKSHLKNSLGPMLMQNVEILENAANGNCPAELGDFVFDAEAFDETDFSDVPVHTTTTTTVAPEKDVQQTTPKSIDGKFTTLKDGQCTSKAYGRLATVVFDARAFDLVDADTAKANFKRFADEIGRLGKKTQKYEMQRGERPDCEVATSGKMPCELLDFPSKEMACQLAERAKKLYLHVRTSCNNAWINIYGQTISSLVEAAEPVSGSCPQIGERMEKQLLQEYTERHAEENDGVDFKQQIKEIRDAVKEDKAERKRERGSKKMRREDREKNKLKNMARRRIESAMVEVNKKQQKLEQLRIAIAAAEAGNYALLARDEENDVVVEENDSGMLMDFGGELYESYEYGEYEEEEEGECAVPVALEIDSAVEFFNALVEAQTSPRSKLLHNAVSHRVKRRFEDVLNFIRVAPGHCPEEVLASCANVNLVYGKRRAKITEIIEAASQIVQNIEEQCEGASFAEFFLSVHGKAENLF
ncbi:Oidioi.mRNA.OKI2018_I69.XSR.g16987.t3.cds [Oikopleura dioica]|nr:Oidioi.mRNA.OKI2018_I69.XSR.g16987.t3.cds [Oikopleura dioica]